MQFPVPPGKGEEFAAVWVLVYGRALFFFIIAIHVLPLVLRIETQYTKTPTALAIGLNLILMVLFMWGAGCFPQKKEFGRRAIRSLLVSRCAYCDKPGWSLGRGVVKDYAYWYHEKCDTEIQNKKAQDDMLEALKGIK